jgi:hypothetical protein
MYTCDWPASGGVCGKHAPWFIDGENYHRPVCGGHGASWNSLRPIEEIDPAKVPQKLPTQAERARLDADGTAQPKTVIEGVFPVDKQEPYRWVFREGATPPLTEAPPSVAPPLSRPPLREALADVAISFLRNLKKKLDEEAK